MGNIKSFCCRDTASEIDDQEERSRILNDVCEGQTGSWDDISSTSAISHQDTPSYGSINTNKLEQTALNKIIQKMASNVIDVAPGEPLVLQQVEVNERQKSYQIKLNQIKTQLTLKSTKAPRWSFNSNSFEKLSNDTNSTFNQSQSPQHHPTPNKSLESRRIDYEPIASDEIQLITQVSQKSAQAVHEGLIIKSDDQVLVPMSNIV